MDAKFAIVTETWLADGPTLEQDTLDLVLGQGVSMICKNRPTCGNGLAYEGVCILYKNAECNFKEIQFDNPGAFEVLVAVGALQGHSRRLVTVGC